MTGFVCWLGKRGLCEVEHTEKSWFIKYIDRSAEKLRPPRRRKMMMRELGRLSISR